MSAVVSIVALMVMVYSVGYMHGEQRYGWYFAVLAFFTAAMHCSTFARVRSTGFSQKIALPARAAAIDRSAWLPVDEAISTAWTCGSDQTSSACAGRAPRRSRNWWVRSSPQSPAATSSR